MRNITDIDDKIIKRAQENKEPVEALTARFIRAMDEDAAALGRGEARSRAARDRTRARDAGDDRARSSSRGLAYRGARTATSTTRCASFPGYGKLSGKSLDDLRAGERVEVVPRKQDPLDFVLWKKAKEGEPSWDSPWGKGRPGWHIECSVMSSALLGQAFRHPRRRPGPAVSAPRERDRAVRGRAPGDTFVNYWMHNGFVRVDNEKMSKSLGNFFTVREVLASSTTPRSCASSSLRAHYRSPLNYSDQHLDDARQALTRLYTALKGVEATAAEVDWNNPYAARFREAMNDDFNTPEAVAVLFDLANELNRSARSRATRDLLKSLGGDPRAAAARSDEFLQAHARDTALPEFETPGRSRHRCATEFDREIASLTARPRARRRTSPRPTASARNCCDAGIVLEDTPQGTTWRE